MRKDATTGQIKGAMDSSGQITQPLTQRIECGSFAHVVFLKKIIRKLDRRLSASIKSQSFVMDVRTEQAIARQTKVIGDLVATVGKFEDDLIIYDWVAKRIIEKFIASLGPILKLSFEEYGDPTKSNSFVESFLKRSKALDCDCFRNEAFEEINELEKEFKKHGDKKGKL